MGEMINYEYSKNTFRFSLLDFGIIENFLYDKK